MAQPNDIFVDVSRSLPGEYLNTFNMDGSGTTILEDFDWLRKLNVQTSMNLSQAELHAKVLNSPRVLNAITITHQKKKLTKKQCHEASIKIFDELAASVSRRNVEALGLLARPLYREVYRGGIKINKNGIDVIQNALKNGPVILCPTHRSHMDYVSMQFAMVSSGLPVPYVIAGDNLNFPIIGRLLRSAGAVFIRRKFGKDAIYWAVFTEYISQLMQSGALIECFIEGARSRSGKSTAPKSGFLEVVTQIISQGMVPDVTFVSVGISFDKMMEGPSYVKEMMGSAKEKESLGGFVQAAKFALRMNLGSIDLSISNKVITWQEYSRTAKYQLNQSAVQKQKLIANLSHRILYESNFVTTVTASSLVAAVLLTSRTRGILIQVLVDRVTSLEADLRSRGATMGTMFNGQAISHLVDATIRMFGKLVYVRNGVVSGYWFTESLELAIYRNAVIHWWISEAVVAVALVTCYREANIPLDGSSENFANKKNLLDRVRFVSQLLKIEFIYKPSLDIEEHFEEVIEMLIQKKVLASPSPGLLQITLRGIKQISFLCMLLWPFIDTYWVCSVTLRSLLEMPMASGTCALIDESKLIEKASFQAEKFYYKGEVAFYESISTDALKNAVKWFEATGITKFQPFESEPARASTIRLIHITIDGSLALPKLCQEICKYRAESNRKPKVESGFTLASRF